MCLCAVPSGVARAANPSAQNATEGTADGSELLVDLLLSLAKISHPRSVQCR